MADRPDLSRTEVENLLRPALYELVCAVSSLESRWAVAGPIERGRMWERMVKAREDGQRVYNSVRDPDPLRCAVTWFDQLDAVWDRCGLTARHDGPHKAGYLVSAEQAGGSMSTDGEGTNDGR